MTVWECSVRKARPERVAQVATEIESWLAISGDRMRKKQLFQSAPDRHRGSKDKA
jgi:hypothetical protein